MAKEAYVRVTLTQIYEKLLDIEEHQIETNGKVKLNRWIATSALSTGFIIIGWFANHLMGAS